MRKTGVLLLAAPQGDDDEGVGSDHVRPRRAGFLQGRLRQARQAVRQARRQPNNGIGDLYARFRRCRQTQRDEIEADIQRLPHARPALAMVDSDKGITNLHVPSDVIVDASMPAVIRACGKMWGPDGKPEGHEGHDPGPLLRRHLPGDHRRLQEERRVRLRTMGTVPNVGLMAQQAEEYGSHDKTFQIPADGNGARRRHRHRRSAARAHVEAGDIWRMCQTQGSADSGLGEAGRHPRPRPGIPPIFWLDANARTTPRSSRRSRPYLKDHDTAGLDIRILSPVQAMRSTLERSRAAGHDLRHGQRPARLPDRPVPDPRTRHQREDAVDRPAAGRRRACSKPVPAVPRRSTSAVPQEDHLRWDSLGEFLALAVSLEDLGIKTGNTKAKLLAKTLDGPTASSSKTTNHPSRKAGELDNRGSHFYLALYWAQALAAQNGTPSLQAQFAPIAETLAENERRSSPSCGRAGQAGRHRRLLPTPTPKVQGDASERDAQRRAGGCARVVNSTRTCTVARGRADGCPCV